MLIVIETLPPLRRVQGEVFSPADLAEFASAVGGEHQRYYVYADGDWAPVCKYIGDSARPYRTDDAAMRSLQCALVWAQALDTARAWERSRDDIAKMIKYTGSNK